MLDQQTIATIKSTIPLLESAGPAMTKHFYQRMFTHNPELKEVFNLAHQHSGGQPVALFNAIAAYAQHIDNLAALTGAVERIAHKHTGFMIQPQQYHIVGTHLLATLKELGGEAVTDGILAAWEKAYGLLASVFIGREEQIYTEREQAAGGWRGTRPFIIRQKRVESDLITSFVLEPKDGGQVVDFIPGQYLSLQLSHPALAHTEIRQYSLSDAPNGRHYRISVKREAGGQVSNLLHDHFEEGDELAVVPPAGDFVLQAEPDTPVVLLSGGVGLTPMLSMLGHLLTSGHQAEIRWLHACEHGGLHAFADEIATKAASHPNLEARTWYRQPRDEDKGRFDFSGQMDLEQIYELLPAGAHYYFCGPEGFMREVKRQLSERGVEEGRLHYEFFGPHQSL